MKDKVQSFFTTWLIILVLNQVFIFRGCFASYCLLAALPHTVLIAFLLVKFGTKDTEQLEDRKYTGRSDKQDKVSKKAVERLRRETAKTAIARQPKQDYLKEKGDAYERFIGSKFEQKGDLVIYNGFIKGYEDQGVDIITISKPTNTIHLIQCKNWTKMRMSLEHMQDIYAKLDNYDFDCLNLPSYEVNAHQTTFPNDKTYTVLAKTRERLSKFTVRKTLYITSEKVVELEVGPYLKMMSPTIFKYRDMKIVMKGCG